MPKCHDCGGNRMKRIFKAGDSVVAIRGKHEGETGTVQKFDRSITTVKFGNVVDPVWSEMLKFSEVRK